ncbi:MAG: cell division protein FtsW, partial [Treponema sp.]|nr:cell division protein FtsW [Treponema sp.]
QLAWSVFGFASMALFAVVPLRFLRKHLGIFVTAIFILCLFALVPFFGYQRNGASRWIRIPYLGRFQPSEFAKFAVVLYLANLFNRYLGQSDVEQKNFLYPLVGLFAFVIVIVLQRDFSTGLFVFMVGCLMFFVSGARMTWFGPLVLLAIPAAILMIVIEPYRLMRIISFLKPDEYMMNEGYQQFASERAIISGGMWGAGLGTGLVNVSRIPEVQSDYIFAGWAAAMGFVGVFAYIALLVFFAWRGFYIALNCPNRFASYGAFGCTAMIVLQSLLNVAVVCGALPTTGIPQPFFSSGGSSLVVTLCMCGFILNASHSEDGDDEDSDFESYQKSSREKDDTRFESFNGVEVTNYE